MSWHWRTALFTSVWLFMFASSLTVIVIALR